jgi:hypothetical protein
MPERAQDNSIDVLLQRVCGEFLEMPGLRLTASQAQRLWGVDEITCEVLLKHLVETKFLCQSAHGTYCRSMDGPIGVPRPRGAKARIGF